MDNYSKAWIRAARVTVHDGDGPGRSFSALDEEARYPGEMQRAIRKIGFRIKSDLSDKPNSSTIRLYNLSPENRAYIEGELTGKKVIVECGYLGTSLAGREAAIAAAAGTAPDHRQAIFSGDIYRAITERKGQDLVTVIETGDGVAAYRDGRISVTAGPGMSYLNLLRVAARSMGLPLDTSAADLAELGQQVLNGRSFHGSSHEFIRRICRTTGHEWSIQMGIVQILKEHMHNEMPAIKLSAEHGLIGRPEPVKQRIFYESTRARRHRAARESIPNEDRGGVRVRCLLFPGLRPGVLVNLVSEEVTGVFVAKQVVHRGDTRGATWETTVDLFEFGEEG